jgi:DNA-binding transcriptional LysR family regulator
MALPGQVDLNDLLIFDAVVECGGFTAAATRLGVATDGRPKHPKDLAQHAWIALTLLPAPLTWKFTSRKQESATVHVKSRFRVDSPGALRAVLRNGAGVSVLEEFSAEEDIRAGRLVRLLPDWKLPAGGIHAVYPPGRHMTAKVRAFIDFYRAFLQAG